MILTEGIIEVERKSNRKNPSYRIITAEDPSCFASEAYRRVKVLLDMYESPDCKVIQICSATPADGKTTTLLNLAVSYAESGKKVLLLDLDLRNPRIHRAFNVENSVGVTNFFSSDVIDLPSIIKHSNYKNMDFICTGPLPIRPNSILSDNKLEYMINNLRKYYDVVLIDEPPVLVVSDCCIIAKYCDGAIFQVSQKNTEKKAAVEAMRILKQNDVNVIGCVFSEVDSDLHSYSYDKYKYRYKY